ncbi:hypothetical protein D3C72_1086770 [compost metagenome]
MKKVVLSLGKLQGPALIVVGYFDLLAENIEDLIVQPHFADKLSPLFHIDRQFAASVFHRLLEDHPNHRKQH